MWVALMSELGFARYGAQGGDIGARVSALTAYEDPAHCIGAQINMPNSPMPADHPEVGIGATKNERIIARMREWLTQEAAYQWIQGTRPQTLSYGLTDSPRRPGRLDHREVARLVGLRRGDRAAVQRRTRS